MVTGVENVEARAGSSNHAGFLAQLKDVPTDAMTRWVGGGSAHPQIPPPFPATWSNAVSYVALDQAQQKLNTWVLHNGIHYQAIKDSLNQSPDAANSIYWRTRNSLRPYDVRVPGVRVLTPRRPYSTNVSRVITSHADSTTVNYANGGDPSGKPDSWVYIRVNKKGQGNLRKLSAATGAASAVVTRQWGPDLSDDGVVHFLLDSHTISTTDPAKRTVTKTSPLGHAPLDSTMVGKQVIFFGNEYDITGADTNDVITLVGHKFGGGERFRLSVSSAGTLPGGLFSGLDYYVVLITDPLDPEYANRADKFRVGLQPGTAFVPITADSVATVTMTMFNDAIYKIVAVDAANHKFTVERDLPSDVHGPLTGLNGGFCILTGANAVQSMAGLAEPANYALQEMTFYIDEHAPVYLTGLDYNTYDSTPFTCPRNYYANGSTLIWGPTINLEPELAFHKRARLDSILLVKMGISASMVSPFLQGQVMAPLPALGGVGFGIVGSWTSDLQSLDYHPSSPKSLYTALVSMIGVAKTMIAAEGKTARFTGFDVNIWDNDPGDFQRVLRLRANTELLVAGVRAAAGNPTLPTTIAGPSTYGGTDSLREQIYEMGVQMGEEDSNLAIVDTRTINSGSAGQPNGDKALDGVHYSAWGQIKLAQFTFDGWDTVQDIDALDVQLAIFNLALSHVGDRAKLTSVNADSAQANYCRTYYPRVVKYLLEHPWSFNTRRRPLKEVTHPTAQHSATPLLVRQEEWRYAYVLPNLPSNFGGALSVLRPGASQDAPTEPFEREHDLNGRMALILTDVEDAVLRYCVTVMNTRKWSESFIMAASVMLGSLIAGPLQKGAEGFAMSQRLREQLREILGTARANDARQRKVGEAIRVQKAPWMPGGGRGV